jgi:CRISPR-associated protein Csb2
MNTQNLPPHLVLTCELTEGHFHGIRLSSSGGEECDWPPAPARVFQSLTHAAFAGIPLQAQPAAATNALHWLERLAAPSIDVSAASDGQRKIKLQNALPLNNKSKDMLTSGLQLAPLRRISRYDLAAATSEAVPLRVRYIWPLPDAAGVPLEDLSELAARVSYFGRAEDRVEMQFALEPDLPAMGDHQQRWVPTHRQGTGLSVPRSQTLDDLKARHQLTVAARVRKPSAAACFTRQSYQDHKTLSFGDLVHVGIVKLVRGEDGDVASFDALYGSKYRAWLRAAILQCAEHKIRWLDKPRAMELLSGHTADGGVFRAPHLAIVPLPSLHSNGMADGNIRRFALVGHAPTSQATEAAEIYRTLYRSLNDVELIHHGQPTGFFTQTDRTAEHTDKVWSLYTGTSDIWTTALPIALNSKFDVSKSLSLNVKHLKRQSELVRLIRRALRNQGLPPETVEQTEIQVSATPFLPKTYRVEDYRKEGNGFLTHARLTFPCQVSGPVIIGDGRYSGMGLCFPG